MTNDTTSGVAGVIPASTLPLLDRVRLMRQADARVSAQAMAKLLGCSGSRVRQLLEELDLPVKVDVYDPVCLWCERPASRHCPDDLCT